MSFNKAFLVGVVGCLCASTSYADDLVQVYNQALHNDPKFKQAQSTWWSNKQNLPLAVSAYLPQVSVTDTLERVYSHVNPGAAGQAWHSQNIVTLSATQAIFDYSAWTNIREQAAAVKSATATYIASIQDLMARTEDAYFSVLDAYDKLRFTIAQKKSVKRQLVTAQQKFKVGLIAITGVYDAQSSFDQAKADEISDRNSLYNALENLRAITGQHYVALQGIQVQVPLITPQPNNINQWVSTAQRQNYSLLAANFDTVKAHENILNQAAAYVPSVDATAQYSATNNWDYERPTYRGGAPANRATLAGDYGLSLNWTPFQGTKNYYSIKQARDDYLTALGKLEETHRDVINQTRQAFLGIISGISRIQADKQSIISTRNALKATEAGYLVGTRTMVNVLDELTKVNQVEFTYMDDQYKYVKDIITLKEQAGTLNFNDMKMLNSWLKKRVVFTLPKNYYSKEVSTAKTPAMMKLHRSLDSAPTGVPSHGGLTPSQSPVTTAMPVHRKSWKKAKMAMATPTAESLSTQGNYVVQFYSSPKQSDVKRYVAHSNIKKQLRIAKQGNEYKALYGGFKTRSDALIALDALPINHVTEHAWVYQAGTNKAKPAATHHIVQKLPTPGSKLHS